MITCCSGAGSVISVYSLRGELQQWFGSHGSGAAGKFSTTRTHYGDSIGRVLVCDRENNRLQVMTKAGEFIAVNLKPAVELPSSAVLYKNHLYVTCDHDNTVRQYRHIEY